MGIISTLYEQNNIKFMMTDGNIDGSPGWACMGKDFPFVTISRETGKWERWLIAAHEMAHLIFGHLEAHNSTLTEEVREGEARIFSCTLMALIAYFEAADAEKASSID